MKKWRFGLLIFFLIVLSYHTLSAEDITLTTYYPAPYGKFKMVEVVEVAGDGGDLIVEDDFTAGGGTMLQVNTTANSVVLQANTIDLMDTGGGVSVSQDLSVGNNATVLGNLIVGSATGTSTISLNGGQIHPDIAEYIRADGCEGGDVVVIDPDNDDAVIKSYAPYDATVAGIISQNPVFKIGDPESGKPLALAGRVMCNATTEGGPIKRGDILVTSSKAGYAMKADPAKLQYGMALGKALSELSEGEGAVLILVKVN
ncbi:MAG: hypothetical protein JW844_02720 [Candidatus Omnitrophica bacterium]|nr:hypothetical protein [Candidatus Omnitrophota bacterium]